MSNMKKQPTATYSSHAVTYNATEQRHQVDPFLNDQQH